MRRALLSLCLLALSACAGLLPTEPSVHPGGLVAWHTLAEGKSLASAQGKPLLVDYYVPSGCSRCETMDRQVWSNPEISAQVNEGFVPVRVNLTQPLTDDERELGARYDFHFDCLLLFLDSEGKVLEKTGGGRMCFADFVDPKWFLDLLAQAREAAARR